MKILVSLIAGIKAFVRQLFSPKPPKLFFPKPPTQKAKEQSDEVTASPSSDENSLDEPIYVYVTEKGKKYHRKVCRIAAAQIRIQLEEALSRYEPCRVCNLPKRGN